MSPALVIHVGAGLMALVAGALAVTVAKGGTVHRCAGIVFSIAMLTMAVMAAWLSLTLPDRGNLPGALFTAYLVATGWGAVRRKQQGIGRFELSTFIGLVVVIAITAAFAGMAKSNPHGLLDGKPADLLIIFTGVELFAASLDVKILVQRRLSHAQRTARHIWRMCAALFFASGSFFLGQQKVMPAAVQGSPVLFILALAPLLIMLFWLWRNRRSSRGRLAAAI